MHDFYKHLSVSEAAELLDSETTFIYKLIRDGKLRPAVENPIKLSLSSLTNYVQKRIPSGFKLVPAI